MNAGPRSVDRLLCGEDGVSAIEYALIASLVAMVVLAGIIVLGNNVRALYDYIASKMPPAPGP